MDSENEVMLLNENKNYDSDADSDTQDIDLSAWNEDRVIESYEQAVSMANLDIAKFIARTTCKTKGGSYTDPIITKKKKLIHKSASIKSKSKKKWEVGMPCRAIYSDDGQEYEAFIAKVISCNECIITFIGYENSQLVDQSTLKPSLGPDERTKQLYEAEGIIDNDFMKNVIKEEDAETDNNDTPKEKPNQKSSSKKKKKKKSVSSDASTETSLPFMPNITSFDPSTLKIPFMPPMPINQLQQSDSDDNLSPMLLSWYMSGYYTGFYQGMKRNSSKKKKH